MIPCMHEERKLLCLHKTHTHACSTEAERLGRRRPIREDWKRGRKECVTDGSAEHLCLKKGAQEARVDVVNGGIARGLGGRQGRASGAKNPARSQRPFGAFKLPPPLAAAAALRCVVWCVGFCSSHNAPLHASRRPPAEAGRGGVCGGGRRVGGDNSKRFVCKRVC